VTAERLSRLGIERVVDLLRHVPRGYEDRGKWIPIRRAREATPGECVAVRGKVVKRTLRRFGRRGGTLRATLEDGTGRIELLWFHAAYLARDLTVDAELAASGRLSKDRALLHPEFARLEGPEEPAPDRLVGIRPIYPITEGVSQRLLREAILDALERLDDLPDPWPEEVRAGAGVVTFARACRLAHRPRDLSEAERGRERLLFDQLLPIEVAMKRRLLVRKRRRAPRADGRGGGADEFLRRLPFAASPSQRAAIEEAARDLHGSSPMGRMLCGEVGSGKTVVALAAMEEARSLGFQCALLAPTDLLARQHCRTAEALLPGGAEGVVLLSGTLTAGDARRARARLEAGDADLAIGTHALLAERTRFARLGLVVIDEQHRFGVGQREALLAKARTPHRLSLTATPIPRSLALLAFGDSEISRLAPRPDARGEVLTRILPESGRDAFLARIRERLLAGEQAFFVRPRIEGDARGAAGLHAELIQGALSGLDVGLIHGRAPPEERESILGRFQSGELAALVTTTLVEVGIDVPGATILWVEGAEGLGLAQLHQLRGRIARRGQRGYCLVVESGDASEESRRRLEAFVTVDDGMRLAEIDLAIRGPGELLGLRQSGHVGLFAGLGSGAPRRIAHLCERAWQVADLLLEREEDLPGEESCTQDSRSFSRPS
jgi:ATP-dependent DNA helicase RecG